MVKNSELLQKLNRKYRRENRMTYKEKLTVLDDMYAEALKLGAIREPKPPMYGLEHIIEMKRRLNCLKKY